MKGYAKYLVLVLPVLALLAVAGPWLGLRDPAKQPDGLVLRDLPPLSRVDALRLADYRLETVAHAVLGRGKKIDVIKFKRRKHHLKRAGHRQWYTEVKITGISG